MRLPHLCMRRMSAAIAMTAAAILIPAVAIASSGSPAARGSRSAGLSRCSAGALTDWFGLPAGAAAGSAFYMLEISNTSHSACTLYGFPGVSATGATGHQLGSAAQRMAGHRELALTLQPQDTVHVVLQIVDVLNYSASVCHPVQAYGLRVYAPGDYAAKVIPFSLRACAKRGPVYLFVSTTVGGTGIP